MAVTLTNRDTAALVLTAIRNTKDGIGYAADLSVLGDVYDAQARFSNVNGKSGVGRSNFHVERLKRNSTTGKIEKISVDITIGIDNGSAYVADDVDDLLSWATNYFSSETYTLPFITGSPRA